MNNVFFGWAVKSLPCAGFFNAQETEWATGAVVMGSTIIFL